MPLTRGAGISSQRVKRDRAKTRDGDETARKGDRRSGKKKGRPRAAFFFFVHRPRRKRHGRVNQFGGRYKDRTCDPYHVKVVLYR
jgi:hypothetical protein